MGGIPLKLVLTVLASLSVNVDPYPVAIVENIEIDPIKYLQTFGWLSSVGDSISLSSPEAVEAVKNFQAFANINITGELDGMTLRVMTLPRCGQSDTDKADSSLVEAVEEVRDQDRGKSSQLRRRQKRYNLQGTRWKVRELNYTISKYGEDLPTYEIDAIIASAFHQWESVANITFIHVTEGKIHIDIRFEVNYHGDEEIFDGPGGTTAHAYFPVYGGDIHFDDDETWTSNSDWGVNLFQVATHEIGHALGLEHSDVQESVMAPFYRTYRKDFQMHSDDVQAIQALYGKRVLTICDSPGIDAATTMHDGNIYLFKGSYVYRFNSEGSLSEGIPTAIAVAFPGLPENIDAAITRSNGVSYIFKGDEFWRVTNMKVDLEFPKMISEYFPGIPAPLDAALVFSVDDNIYFFKESQYYKFDHRKNPPVSIEYPKYIYSWEGIPKESLEAAVSLQDSYGNNYTYFFKGNQYWKFNDRSRSVFISDPPYPRSISRNLLGCKY